MNVLIYLVLRKQNLKKSELSVSCPANISNKKGWNSVTKLMFYVLSNSYVQALILNVIIFGDGAFRGKQKQVKS